MPTGYIILAALLILGMLGCFGVMIHLMFRTPKQQTELYEAQRELILSFVEIEMRRCQR